MTRFRAAILLLIGLSGLSCSGGEEPTAKPAAPAPKRAPAAPVALKPPPAWPKEQAPSPEPAPPPPAVEPTAVEPAPPAPAAAAPAAEPAQEPAVDLRAELDRATGAVNFLGLAAQYAALRGRSEVLRELLTSQAAARARMDGLIAQLRDQGRAPHVDDTMRGADVLLSLDAHAETSLGPERFGAAVGTFLAQLKAGSRARVIVRRDGKSEEFTVRFDERPKEFLPVLQTLDLIPGQVVAAAPEPAKPAAPPAPAPAPASPPASEPGAPEPSPVAPRAEAPPPAVPKRVAVPDAAALKEPEKEVRAVFKDEYARKGLLDQQVLAKKLLQEGSAAGLEPAVRFVMLRDARDIAAATGEYEVALAAVDRLVETFALERAAAKSALLAKAAAPRGADAIKAYAKACLTVIEEALGEGDVASAASLTAKADAAGRASADAVIAARAAGLKTEVAFAQKEASAVQRHRKTLETKPDDPEANAAVGRFLTLVLRQADEGLPMLAKGSDAVLKSIAERELSAPVDPAARAALGDAWWDASEKERNADYKRRMRDQAFGHYERALPGLSGLGKVKVEQRLKESGRTLLLVDRTVKSSLVGGSGGGEFTDMPSPPALLVGLRYNTAPFGSSVIIRSMQPIFLRGAEQVEGKVYGGRVGTPEEVVAKPGYAVGGIVLKGGLRVDAMKIVFMRVAGTGLDPRDKYESKWLGGTGGGDEVRLGGDGAFVVGLHGRSADDVDSVGLVQAAR